MAKVIALIAILLLTGLAGGSNAFATSDIQTVAASMSGKAPIAKTQQVISADHHAAHGAGASECCTDSSCFNSSHCHHAGCGAALLNTLDGVMGIGDRDVYATISYRIPVLNVAYSISKPPRA